MEVSADRVLEVLRAFVARRSGAPADEIGLDTELFQEGWLDSFAVVELLAELETALAVPLPAGAVIPEDFATPRTLVERLAEL